MSVNLDSCRKEYAKQRKLERFVDSRQLIRPNVKKWQVAISFATLSFLIFAAIYLPIVATLSVVWEIVLITVLVTFIIESYLRFCLILAVKCYQHYAKEETRRKCFCVPSCSQYAIISLKKFPLMVALFKIRKRLFVTCDGQYKIDFPTKKMNEEFERNL